MVASPYSGQLSRTVATASIAFQRARTGERTRDKGAERNGHCRGSPWQRFLPGEGLILRPVGTDAILSRVIL